MRTILYLSIATTTATILKSPDPIAISLMQDPDNFSDFCTPSSDCWPSEDEWDELDISLGGKLLQNVEPYLGPCHGRSLRKD